MVEMKTLRGSPVSGEETEDGVRTVCAGGMTFGGGSVRICVPVVARREEELEAALSALKKSREDYDLVEFRADYYPLPDPGSVRRVIGRVKEASGDAPLLFTYRTAEEGGAGHISDREYRDMNLTAASFGADLVDVQLQWADSDMPGRRELIGELQKKGAAVIGSYHDFQGTPPAEEMVRKLARMQILGFDITKIAVMPKDREDVLELMFASVSMREGWADRPYVTMAMGDIGRISRAAGSFTGSCITFGSLTESSAPGQIPAHLLRQVEKAIP